MAAEFSIEPGQTIGGCRIVRHLGGGAMGAVYLAKHVALHKDVAVKFMSHDRDGSRSTTRVQRFQTEARLAAQIEHPNIVQVLNVGCENELNFIVMQYVEGESLAARLAREEKLPPAEAARIAACIARGLAAAHEKGVIHRDIKPANVMLTRDGAVKVADLGLARAVNQSEDTSLTQEGATLGTPLYMPPEQAEDARSADARSDIYALGCTLYHALVGAPPFTAGSAVGIITRHLHDTAIPPAKANPGVPEALSGLVVQMLAKSRDERPQRMALVAEELEQFAAGGTPAARQTKTSAPPRSREGSRPWLPISIGAGLGILFLVLAAGMKPAPGQVAFEKAKAAWEKNSADYDSALAAFQQTAQQYPQTRWAREAEQAAQRVREARDQAAAAAFDQTSKAAQAAAQKQAYAAAVAAWDDFPRALLVGETVEKVRIARLKARLPARADTFVRAYFANNDDVLIQHIDPQEVLAKGREPLAGFFKLLRGFFGFGFDIEGYEIKKIELSDDLKRGEVLVAMKVLNKLNKQRETKDMALPWQAIGNEWYYYSARPAR